MPPTGRPTSAQILHWDGRRLQVLDQTRLPAEEVVLTLTGADDTAEAIRRLAVRGAPLIGVAAAYGAAMEMLGNPDPGPALARLAAARPTARNLAWAVQRVAAAADPLQAAEAIAREDAAASAALAVHGADELERVLPLGPLTVLTHCNSGALAASGRGTGLGVIAELADRRNVTVLACEARPLLQGARLTVWELKRLGIAHALLVDSAAAGLIRRGEVHAVVTGLDRVAANGDVANKVGTYPLALAAAVKGIPFVAAGPSSSIDLSLPSGDAIEIEERDPAEVRGALPEDTPCRNPAFDVTPAELVWALVTERGVARPVDAASVAAVA
jgi:S-methyl-5-thioribose-1-phosphate isomerase